MTMTHCCALAVTIEAGVVLERFRARKASQELLALILVCAAAIERSQGRLSFGEFRENDGRVTFINSNTGKPFEERMTLHLVFDGVKKSFALEFAESCGMIDWTVTMHLMFKMFLQLKHGLPESFEVAKEKLTKLCERFNIRQSFDVLERNCSSRSACDALSLNTKMISP